MSDNNWTSVIEDLYARLLKQGMHPTAYLYEAWLEGGYVCGRCLHHARSTPSGEFADNHQIQTSLVVAHNVLDDVLIVRTFSGSTYILLSYAEGESMEAVASRLLGFEVGRRNSVQPKQATSPQSEREASDATTPCQYGQKNAGYTFDQLIRLKLKLQRESQVALKAFVQRYDALPAEEKVKFDEKWAVAAAKIAEEFRGSEGRIALKSWVPPKDTDN
jgi:hypothetical protein